MTTKESKIRGHWQHRKLFSLLYTVYPSIFSHYKRKFYHIRFEEYFKYDLIRWYRNDRPSLEHEIEVEKDIAEFEARRQKEGATKRKILRSAASSTT